jgi:hypothetical protein
MIGNYKFLIVPIKHDRQLQFLIAPIKHDRQLQFSDHPDRRKHTYNTPETHHVVIIDLPLIMTLTLTQANEVH